MSFSADTLVSSVNNVNKVVTILEDEPALKIFKLTECIYTGGARSELDVVALVNFLLDAVPKDIQMQKKMSVKSLADRVAEYFPKKKSKSNGLGVIIGGVNADGSPDLFRIDTELDRVMKRSITRGRDVYAPTSVNYVGSGGKHAEPLLAQMTLPVLAQMTDKNKKEKSI